MENQQEMSEFRIIIIDDNPSIHSDVMKVLTVQSSMGAVDARDELLFGDDVNKKNIGDIGKGFPVFSFETASQGEEGIDKIEKAILEKKPYALAFVDIRMPPGLDGVETAKKIWDLDPDIQLVICTAYSDYNWEEMVAKLGMSDNFLILKKPFDNMAIRQLACALTRKWLLSKDSKNTLEHLNEMVSEKTESLEYSLSLLRATLESSTEGVVVVDFNNNVIDYNMRFVNMWKIPESVFFTKKEDKIQQYIGGAVNNSELYLRQSAFVCANPEDNFVKTIDLKDGRIFEWQSRPHMVHGETVGYVRSYRDITERSYLEKELEHKATHDALIDLPNRTLLNDRIQHAIAAAGRMKKYFSILMLDLDRFKAVNDSLGHDVGDQLLCAVAGRLKGLLRKSDTLARLGGDEFVILLQDADTEKQIVPVVKKIVSEFSKSFFLGEQEVIVGVSIGVSCYPADGVVASDLLKTADLAMYKAKENGGNQFVFYDNQLDIKGKGYFDQENELRHAIEHNELFLVYQPQFDMDHKKLLALEALLRWKHPLKGLIGPLEFIPLAEETGLIVALGDWVLREVCRQIKAWKDQGLPYVQVAVNVATKQLKQADFAEKVEALLEEYGIPPDYLELEITENVIITHLEVLRMLEKLKAMHIKVSLDDFGTGNSGLSYLKQINIDRLKIDRSFVNNISLSRSDEVIIESIIAMAKSLNCKVLAEGVETQAQCDFLKSKNCDEVQGFLYSKPITPEEVAIYLQQAPKVD